MNAALMGAVDCRYSLMVVKRILVTGGRDYGNRAMIAMMLEAAALMLGPHTAAEVVLVHGDCKRYLPDGTVDPDRSADHLAAQVAAELGWQVEPHGVTRAEYDRDGPRAFLDRNTEMVEAGADVCVAFPGGEGTRDCAEKARKAGIRRILVEDLAHIEFDRC